MTGRVTIGSTTISALRAQRELQESSKRIGSAFERLSSGLRINKPSDDASGRAVAAALNSDTRVFSQGLRNLNDGMSALNVAEGALRELTAITIRQRELATQAANGLYTQQQRLALNKEANQLVDEFNRITASTRFNGRSLLDLSTSEFRLQAGYGNDGSVAFGMGEDLGRTVGSGEFADSTTYAGTLPTSLCLADFNGDQQLDIAVKFSGGGSAALVRFGNPDGTFQAGVAVGSATASGGEIISADFNGDRNADLCYVKAAGTSDQLGVVLGNGNGTFGASINAGPASFYQNITAADMNSDGNLDLVIRRSVGADYEVGILAGNGNGTFSAFRGVYTSSTTDDFFVGDFNGDNRLDIALETGTTLATASILLGNGDYTFRNGGYANFGVTGTFSRLSGSDFNNDGALDLVAATGTTVSVALNNGDSTFQAGKSCAVPDYSMNLSVVDCNGDGKQDVVAASSTSGPRATVLLGNGDGSLRSAATLTSPDPLFTTATGDFNRDGAPDIVSRAEGMGLRVWLAEGAQVTTMPYLNIATQSGARQALAVIDGTMARVADELGAVGTAQSRLETSMSVLGTGRLEYEAAAARIQDADVAEESAGLLRQQILQQAASAVLSQANQQPALALRLLT